MITEIPTASDFHTAGLNQLYLAWQVAMQVTRDYDEAQQLAPDMDEEAAASASAAFWSKSQPALANAFGLIQQAMEMALKGRIAAISPYLLIARDPKDWPSSVETNPVPFSDFRTLDAADLVKVHNTFAATPLDNTFRTFWDGVRRDRNKLMHSVSGKTFQPAALIRNVLTAAETLFSEVRWPQRLLIMEADGAYAAYGLGSDYDHNVVMNQIETAVENLTPAETKRFFGFDPKRRAYVCPLCWGRADHDWQEDWPALAQLSSKSPGETSLHCIVCNEVTNVERLDCINPHCKGNVIHDETCFTCLWSQDSPHNFPSGLQNEKLSIDHEYGLHYDRPGLGVVSSGRFLDDTNAIEHARRAMDAPYLQIWRTVTVSRRVRGMENKVIGTWIRETAGLVWHPGFKPSMDFFESEPSDSPQSQEQE